MQPGRGAAPRRRRDPCRRACPTAPDAPIAPTGRRSVPTPRAPSSDGERAERHARQADARGRSPSRTMQRRRAKPRCPRPFRTRGPVRSSGSARHRSRDGTPGRAAHPDRAPSEPGTSRYGSPDAPRVADGGALASREPSMRWPRANPAMLRRRVAPNGVIAGSTCETPDSTSPCVVERVVVSVTTHEAVVVGRCPVTRLGATHTTSQLSATFGRIARDRAAALSAAHLLDRHAGRRRAPRSTSTFSDRQSQPSPEQRSRAHDAARTCPAPGRPGHQRHPRHAASMTRHLDARLPPRRPSPAADVRARQRMGRNPPASGRRPGRSAAKPTRSAAVRSASRPRAATGHQHRRERPGCARSSMSARSIQRGAARSRLAARPAVVVPGSRPACSKSHSTAARSRAPRTRPSGVKDATRRRAGFARRRRERHDPPPMSRRLDAVAASAGSRCPAGRA